VKGPSPVRGHVPEFMVFRYCGRDPAPVALYTCPAYPGAPTKKLEAPCEQYDT